MQMIFHVHCVLCIWGFLSVFQHSTIHMDFHFQFQVTGNLLMKCNLRNVMCIHVYMYIPGIL